jgi:hypothetical protein
MSAGPRQDEFAVANLADSVDKPPAWRIGLERRGQPRPPSQASSLTSFSRLPNDNGQHYRLPEGTDLLD